jgi:hypothetical protein
MPVPLPRVPADAETPMNSYWIPAIAEMLGEAQRLDRRRKITLCRL